MRKTVFISFLTIATALFISASIGEAAKKPKYTGYKKCGGCHKSQKDSWLETRHAKAFESLKANEKTDEKKKAKLDPEKDYTKDKKCVGCHVTGFNKRKGYKIGLKKSKAKYLNSVGCETCHGAGDFYRKEHRSAGNEHKKTNKSSPRKKLESLGQNVSTEDIQEACNGCHLNYEGSSWKGAKEPYTPFTPQVDKKYQFNFDERVKDTKAMHEHFKMRNVFEGKPVFKYRGEFQKEAKEPAAEEDEDDDDDEDDEDDEDDDGEE
jgi:hypothetical protein